MRGFAVIFVALALCAPAALSAPRGQVAAAKKAERRGQWSKALRAWKAAYAKEGAAEYLISIGDAYAKLGKTAEARKSYEKYLADPLAQPSRIARVNSKIAQLSGAPALLQLPGPTLAAAPAVAVAAKTSDLPPLPLPAAPPRPKAARPEPVAPAASAPLPAASNEPLPPSTKLAVAAPAAPDRQAPLAAVTPMPLQIEEQRGSSGRVQRTLAYTSAVVAVVALGGGALAWQQANSTHSELTNGIHSSADTQRLMDNEQRSKTLSVIGLAGGLVLAGVSTALFVF